MEMQNGKAQEALGLVNGKTPYPNDESTTHVDKTNGYKVVSPDEKEKFVVAEETLPKHVNHGKWDNQIEFILSCIGYAVGLGNIWRFPYLCMQYGGGAFLIPYFVSLLICGTPLFFLELVIGQFSGLSPIQVWNVCPLFKGLGVGMFIVSGIVVVYYNVIITWVLYYLFKSLTKTLPWSECGKWWNTPLCYKYTNYHINTTLGSNYSTAVNYSSYTYDELPIEEIESRARIYANLSHNATIPWKSPAEEFWQREVLEESSGIDDIGGVRWELFGCFVLSWVIVFLCLSKGIKTSGKVVYVTATAPYVLLTILLIRGVTLPGAIDGIKFYIYPDLSKLLDFRVWATACIQVFYSLGPAWGGLITMASYNKFDNNIARDAITVPLVTGGTSLYGGFVLFSVVGFMARQTGRSVKEFLKSGPGLAFIAYPESLTHLPISPLWAVFFFLMLLTVGLDSQFGMFETVTSSIFDNLPKAFRKRKLIFTALICVVEILIGTLFVTRAGIYYFQIIDWYSAAFSVTFIALFECFALAWLYGHERLYLDIKMMLGHRPNIFWKICWCFITPTILLVIILYSAFYMSEPTYGEYTYPRWAIVLGWSTGMMSLIPIPIFMVIAILKNKGTFLQRLQKSIQPTSLWGPSDPEKRMLYKATSSSPDRLVFCGRKNSLDDENV